MKNELFVGQRVAVFMDVQSLYYGCKDAHGEWHRIMYGPLLEEIVQERTLVRAIAYLRYHREADTHGFHRALNQKGFEVKSKPAYDSNKQPQSWAVGMTLDILDMRDKLDLAIVLTQEGDFADSITHLSERGIPCEVWGFEKGLSHALKQNAAKFHFIPSDVVEDKPPRD